MSYFIINTAVASIYQEASHTSAMVSQALLGETCEIIDQKDNWYRIRQWDGYKGWIYYFSGVVNDTSYKSTMILGDIFGELYTENKQTVLSKIVYGTQLNAQKLDSGYKIVLPDGNIAFSSNDFTATIPKATRQDIIDTAQRFLGVPYLWGGKSPYGMDCSGLVQTVFKGVGINLPRDAYQQEKLLRKNMIKENKFQIGDLIFFGKNGNVNHVALISEGSNFFNSRGSVRKESIDDKSALFNRKLQDIFLHGVSIKELLEE